LLFEKWTWTILLALLIRKNIMLSRAFFPIYFVIDIDLINMLKDNVKNGIVNPCVNGQFCGHCIRNMRCVLMEYTSHFTCSHNFSLSHVIFYISLTNQMFCNLCASWKENEIDYNSHSFQPFFVTSARNWNNFITIDGLKPSDLFSYSCFALNI